MEKKLPFEAAMDSIPFEIIIPLVFFVMAGSFVWLLFKSKAERGHFDEPPQELREKYPATTALSQMLGMVPFLLCVALIASLASCGSEMTLQMFRG